MQRPPMWLTLMAVLLAGITAKAQVFGELEGTVGGTFPDGSFTRYADAGVILNGRLTVRLPESKSIEGWSGFSAGIFSSETIETETSTTVPGGSSIVTTVDQQTTETMVAGHAGIQFTSAERIGFFRPHAAAGIGLYYFRTDVTWTSDDGDQIADVTDDAQTSWGWRGIVGADFFFTSDFGISANYLYDHVFDLNQQDGPQRDAALTSRFHGFSIGVVYLIDA